jgi:SPP1 family phage portal protein
MDEIELLLSTNQIESALKLLTVSQLNQKEITALQEEHDDVKRNIRNTQIGRTQKDKEIKDEAGDLQSIVPAVRIPIPFQNKIVRTATAFEVGNSPDIIPNEANDLSAEVLRLWRMNRIDSKINQMVSLKKSELQCALMFYIKDYKTGGIKIINKIVGKNKNREIKSRVLTNDKGLMSPYFDSTGDMLYFTWQFNSKDSAGKEVKNVWVYNKEKVYKSDNAGGIQTTISEAHGFSNIPVVYITQEKPEWFVAQDMIDRIENTLSRLSASNDYSGHPILVLTGDVEGAPDKDDDGKAFKVSQEIDEDSGAVVTGKVEFLTRDQAPESVELELDNLLKYIYSLTSTPDISFENMKGMGEVSGVALEFLFLDAILKAKMNEPENRTMIERIISIMISGTITTTLTNLSSKSELTYFDIRFNSILPNDLKATVEWLSKATGDKAFVSQETAVKILNIVEDHNEELQRINGDPDAEEEEEEEI